MLRSHIASGILSDPFPGENALADQIGVSRPILRQALRELAAEKLIIISNGKRTRLVKALRPGPGRCRRVLAISSRPLRPHWQEWDGRIIEEIRDLLKEKGFIWNEFHEPRLRFAAGIPLLKEAVRNSACDCLLLIGTSKAVQKWAMCRRGSSLILGSAFPGISLPSVDSDYHALGWHAAGRLAAAGHSRIALLCRRPPLRGDLSTREGMQEFFSRHPHFDGELTIHDLSESIDEICQLTERLLRKRHPPTALMPFYPADAVTIATHLLKTGRRIPQDIAVVSRETAPLMEAMTPEITRYERNQRQIVHRVARAIGNLCSGRQNGASPVLISPRFIAGHTL